MITGLFMGVAIDVAVEEKTEALKDVSSLTWFGLGKSHFGTEIIFVNYLLLQ